MEAQTLTANAQTTSETSEASLLEQAIEATRQTSRPEVEDLLKNLVEQAMSGTVTWDKNLTVTVNAAIEKLDQLLSKQLAELLHNPSFTALEGSWRGLQHLVFNAETSSSLKIRLFNLSKKELSRDLEKAVEFDQSQLFKKIYENEFGTAGGEPYAALIGDYEFSTARTDIELLRKLSNVSAAGFCPFIAAASPSMFGFEGFDELSRPRDLEKIFESAEYANWRALRETEDSRFVALTLPRVLARAPYSCHSNPIEDFNFDELEVDASGTAKAADATRFCWMNAAYTAGVTLAQSFSQYGWCTSIRGAEGGGKVTGLPMHCFTSDDGDLDQMCPTEIGITDRREAELSKLGFLPLCHYKNSDYAVFFGSQTTQKSKKFANPDATANAAISSRLPYIMATSRIAHFLKVMARDKIGTFMEAEDAQAWLNRWLNQYVNASPGASAEMKARYPLAEARVEVKEIPGQPGVYNAIAWMRPWLQMEELTASMRLVANLPSSR